MHKLTMWLRAMALVCAILGVFPGTPAFSSESLPVEDRMLIHDLISHYGRHYDDRQAEAWTALFTEDAPLSLFILGKLAREINSNDERRAWAKSRFETFEKDGVIKTRHFQTNTLLKVVEEGAVEGVTVFLVTYQYAAETTPRVIHTGEYRDRFVRTTAGWRFAKREIGIDHK